MHQVLHIYMFIKKWKSGRKEARNLSACGHAQAGMMWLFLIMKNRL